MFTGGDRRNSLVVVDKSYGFGLLDLWHGRDWSSGEGAHARTQV
jgi:hypothetical protein